MDAIEQADKTLKAKTVEDRQAELLRRLQRKGVLRNIPPRRKVKREFRPIQIKGKPISETIIEERR